MSAQADGGSSPPTSSFMLGAVLGCVLLLGVWFAAFHVPVAEQADRLVFAGFAGLHRWKEAYTLSTLLARLCDPRPYLVLAAVPVLLAAARRRPRGVAAALALLIGANLTTELVKLVFAAPRRSWVTGGIMPSSTSWPSGHATAAMALAMACIIVAPARSRTLLAALGGAFAVAVSYACMTLRWHYTSDVLGGFLVAGVWASFVLGCLRLRAGSRVRRVRGAALAPPLAGAVPIAAAVAVSLPHEISYAHRSVAFLLGTAIVTAVGLALVTGFCALVTRTAHPGAARGRRGGNYPAAGQGRPQADGPASTSVASVHRSPYPPLRRAFDVIAAGCALLLAGLPLIVIATLIKLSDPSAPVFFRQRRCGDEGRLFDLLKFRTMVKNADELKEALRHLSEVAWPDFRLTNDPRVTRIGRFLRKTSLDELPQLLNVLRGDMALIGPRPTSFHADTYQLWHTERLERRPGLTGPWQVWGRSTLDFDERCRLEISFFRSARLPQNVRVLLGTVGALLKQTGVA